MSLFNAATQAPADPILGLSTKFREDSRENKVNLGVGVFVDANGVTPVLPSVTVVEKQLAEASASKSYLPMTGAPPLKQLLRSFVLAKLLLASLMDASSQPKHLEEPVLCA